MVDIGKNSTQPVSLDTPNIQNIHAILFDIYFQFNTMHKTAQATESTTIQAISVCSSQYNTLTHSKNNQSLISLWHIVPFSQLYHTGSIILRVFRDVG